MSIFKQLVAAIRRARPISGPGIRVTPTADGHEVGLESEYGLEGGDSSIGLHAELGIAIVNNPIATITVGNPFICDLYGLGFFYDDGSAKTPTLTSQYVRIPKFPDTAWLKNDDPILVWKVDGHWEGVPGLWM